MTLTHVNKLTIDRPNEPRRLFQHPLFPETPWVSFAKLDTPAFMCWWMGDPDYLHQQISLVTGRE